MPNCSGTCSTNCYRTRASMSRMVPHELISVSAASGPLTLTGEAHIENVLVQQSGQNFEVPGLVNSPGIVLIVNRGGVQSVRRWLPIAENPVMGLSAVCDHSTATTRC